MSNYCSFSVGVSSSRVRGVGGEEGLHLCGGEEGLHRFFFVFFSLHPSAVTSTMTLSAGGGGFFIV